MITLKTYKQCNVEYLMRKSQIVEILIMLISEKGTYGLKMNIWLLKLPFNGFNFYFWEK